MSGLDSASVPLILFGLIAAVIANLSRAPAWRSGVLIAASAIFLVALAPRLLDLLPLLGFLVMGYVGIDAARRGVPWARLVTVLLLIVAFAWLKRYSFLPEASFLAIPYVTLGLSYIFFRVLHLAIEARRPAFASALRPASYVAYTLNFTTLISGPIQRFDDFHGQLADTAPRLDVASIGAQLERIAIGFFKVNVLGLLLSMIQLDAFAELARSEVASAHVFAFARLIGSYPFFLYCNFSGYIDIVIAIAGLMGLRLPENFNRPFSATSFLDFWNRWHITLSGWLKSYVYNPLLIALMRRFPSPALEQVFGIACFFVTFFLIGIWHGRTSEFAVFGVLQGGGVAVNKAWQVFLSNRLGRKPYRALAAQPVYAMCARGLTFSWFALSLLWFWASWTQIDQAFAGAAGGSWLIALALLWLVATVGLALWETVFQASRASPHLDSVLRHPATRTAFVTLLSIASFLFVAVLSQPAPGIVYRTF